MSIAKLVTKPTASDEAKENVLTVLRETLAEAEAGDVSAVVVLAYGPDGKWYNHHSGVMSVGLMIGHLEIAKLELMQDWQKAHADERFPH